MDEERGSDDKTDIDALLVDELLDETSLIDQFVLKPGKPQEGGDQENLADYLSDDDL